MINSLAGLILQIALASTASQETAIKNIQKVQETLQAMGMNGSINRCDPHSAKSECDFGGFCGQVVQNRNKAFVYEDSGGRKVPNYNLLFLKQNLDLCLAANGKEKSAPMLAEQDPFTNPQLLFGPDAKKYDQVFAKEDQRARNLGADVKRRMISVLKAKRNSQNAKAIDNMISRLETVQIAAFKPKNEEELYEKSCYLPNAAYTSEGNKIIICPQMLTMPEATLEMVLAHELAHVIDTCSSAKAISQEQGEMKLRDPNWAMGKILIEAIPTSQNPYAKTIQCLQEPSSLGYKLRTNEDKIADLKQYLAGLDEEGADPENPDIQKIHASLRDLEEATEQSYCPQNDEDKNAHYMQEGFSDWMATQILAEKLKSEKDPAKAKATAFETQLLGLQSDCPGFAEDQKANITKQMQAAGCSKKSINAVSGVFALDQSPGGEEHPGWAERSNKIYLAEPEFQKALSCQPSKDVKACQ